MKHHEREFFISTIRTGNFYIDDFVVKPLTIEQTIQAANEYNRAFVEAKEDGVMDEEEMLAWMKTEGFWHKANETKLEKLKEESENVKVQIYQNFIDKSKLKTLKVALRHVENMISEQHEIKNAFYTNTCEGIANLEKTNWILRNTTFLNGNLHRFDDDTLFYVSSQWQKNNLPESVIRELARTDPWRSIWSVFNHINRKLFLNDDEYELNFNQKNLVIWSKLYDNINESPDCPSEEIISDDDALDGWFIYQNRKRKQEKKQSDIDNKIGSQAVRNSEEVFVMSRSQEVAQDIYSANNFHNRNVIKNRSQQIKEEKVVEHHKLLDQKLKIKSEANRRFKNK